MQEIPLAEALPERLRKEVESRRYEVPIAPGESRTVHEHFYSTRLLRWLVRRWLDAVPHGGDLVAFRRALENTLVDDETFEAHVRVPDAFADAYLAEMNEVSRYDADLHSVKRLLRHQTLLPWLTMPRLVTVGIFAAYGLALAAIVR